MVNKVSVILPVLNEPYLPKLIEELDFHLGDSYEIIVVTSDKSKSNLTEKELFVVGNKESGLSYLSPVQPKPKIIKIIKSYADSLERSILLGFSVATGNKIIVMDADGSHPSSLVPKMAEELNEYEMVVASRFVDGGKYVTSFFRYIITSVFTDVAQLLGSSLTDPMSGFFGIRSELLNHIKFKPYKWKTALEINNKLRPKTKEIPYTFHNREEGRSKSDWKIGLTLLWDITAGAL